MKKTIAAENIIAAYEKAKDSFFSGEITKSEEFEILKKHIGGEMKKNGDGYSQDYFVIVGFLMGLSVNSQETA